MTLFLFGAAVGLVVGWNLLPQPTWVAVAFAKFSDKIKSLGSTSEQ